MTSAALAPVYAAHTLVHLLLTLFPAVLFVLKQKSGLSYAALGATYTAAMLVYGLGAIPVGLLANRIRPLTFLRVSTAAAALAAAGLAAAPGMLWFAAALVALGAACSVHHTAALTLIARVGQSDSRLFGNWATLGTLGLALAPAFGGLLAAWAGWRLPFAIGAVLGLAAAAWLWLGTRRIDDGTPVAEMTESDPHPTHMPSLVLILAISAALGFVCTGFTAFLPAMTGARVGFFPASTLVRGGLVASLIYAVGACGAWWGGHVGERGSLERRYALIIAANALLLVLVVLFRDWALVAVLVAFSFVHFSTQPLENVLIARFTSLRARGMSFAVSCVTALGVGSVGAYVGGVVADAAGGRLEVVYALLAAVATVAVVCAVALIRSARAARRPPRRCTSSGDVVQGGLTVALDPPAADHL